MPLDSVCKRPGAPARATLYRVLHGMPMTVAFIDALARALKVDEALIREVAAEDGVGVVTEGPGQRSILRVNHFKPGSEETPETAKEDGNKASLERPQRAREASEPRVIVKGQTITMHCPPAGIDVGTLFDHDGHRYECRYVDPDGFLIRGRRVVS